MAGGEERRWQTEAALLMCISPGQHKIAILIILWSEASYILTTALLTWCYESSHLRESLKFKPRTRTHIHTHYLIYYLAGTLN